MINKILKIFILINYCGQRATGSFFTKQSVVNILMFELSFITLPITFMIIFFLGIRNQLIVSITSFIL